MSTSLKVVLVSAAAVIVLTVQCRTMTRLKRENQELQGAREQAKQMRIELEEAAQMAAQNGSDAKSLRMETIALRSTLQTAQQELEVARSAAKQAAAVRPGASALLGPDGAPPLPEARLYRPSQQRKVFHLLQSARINLAASLSARDFVYRSGGRIDELEVCNSISRDAVKAGPDWGLSQPLPLSFAGGEAVAREELRKVVHDEAGWEVTDISLHRLPEVNATKWHYSFQFTPRDRTDFDTFTVHVSLNGAPGVSGLQPADHQ